MELLNQTMHDGSRHFALLPVGKVSPVRLLFRILTLWGAFPTAFVPSLAESWIDFRFRGFKFSINDQYGDYWFFVQDPGCPESILIKVAQHFEEVLQVAP